MVASDYGDVLRESLCDDLAIKRIGVVRRQGEQTKRVLGCVGQDTKAKFVDSLPRCTVGELEFSSRALDGDFRERYGAKLQDIRRILYRRGGTLAKPLGGFNRQNQSYRVQQEPHDATPAPP